MTKLIVGVTVCTGIWTKVLAVFKHCWWTAYVKAAAGAGILYDRCRHQFVGSQLFIAANRYLVPEKCLRVAQCSQIMKMVITFVLLLSWSVRSGFSVLGWVGHRYRLHRLVIVLEFVSFLALVFTASSLLACVNELIVLTCLSAIVLRCEVVLAC